MSCAIISQPIHLQKHHHPQPIEFDGVQTLVVSGDDEDEDFCTQSEPLITKSTTAGHIWGKVVKLASLS